MNSFSIKEIIFICVLYITILSISFSFIFEKLFFIIMSRRIQRSNTSYTFSFILLPQVSPFIGSKKRGTLRFFFLPCPCTMTISKSEANIQRDTIGILYNSIYTYNTKSHEMKLKATSIGEQIVRKSIFLSFIS